MSNPKRLRVTELVEFSLVDRPANPLATIQLFKRDTSTESDMAELDKREVEGVMEKLAKWLGFKAHEPEGSDDVEKRVRATDDGRYEAFGDDSESLGVFDTMDEAEAAIGKADAGADEAESGDNGTAATKESAMADQPNPEAVSKADVEALQKRLDEANERIEKAEAEAKARSEQIDKLENEKRDAEFVKRAEGFKSLPIKAAEFGPVLRKVADALGEDSKEYAEVQRVLEAANEASRTSKLFQEVGSDQPAEGSAQAEVEKLADEYQKEDRTLSRPGAVGLVYMRNPELRQKVEAEQAQPGGRN